MQKVPGLGPLPCYNRRDTKLPTNCELTYGFNGRTPHRATSQVCSGHQNDDDLTRMQLKTSQEHDRQAVRQGLLLQELPYKGN